jgi:tetratricopeptide (TPR) repeat protein
MSETSEQNLFSDEAIAARDLALHGREFWHQGDHAAAFDTWNDVVELFATSPDTRVRRCVAWTLWVVADQRRKLGQNEESARVFDQLNARYGGREEPSRVTSMVMQSFTGHLATLSALGREADRMRVCDQMIDRDGSSVDLATRRSVALAIAEKARMLRDLGQTDEASELDRELDRRFRDSRDPEIRREVARSLLSAAMRTKKRGNVAEMMEILTDLDVRYGAPRESKEVLIVATQGLREQIRVLKDDERHEDALALWRRVGERTSGDPASEPLALHATALAGQVKELRVLGRYEEAITVCDELTERYDDEDTQQVDRAICEALWEKTRAAAKLEREQLALDTADELLRRFSDAPDKMIVPEIVAAQQFRIISSLLRGENNRALATSERHRATLRRLPDPSLIAPFANQLLRVAESFRGIAVREGRSSPEGLSQLVLLHVCAVAAVRRSRPRRFLAEAALLDEMLIDGIGDAHDVTARVPAVKAQLQLLRALSLLGRWRGNSKVLGDLAAGGQPVADALRVISDEALREEPSKRVLAANALSIRVSTLSTLGDSAAVRSALDEMTTLFGRDRSPRIRMAVWSARHLMVKPSKG